MLRLTEFGLFLVPLTLYVAWRVLGARLPPAAIWATLALILLMIAGTLWFGLTEKLDPDQAYAPARLENGRVVEGHGVPR